MVPPRRNRFFRVRYNVEVFTFGSLNRGREGGLERHPFPSKSN